ncbi:MAG: glycerate kinase, partial [Bacteroidales bacterium]
VGILRAAKKADIPVIGLAGCVEETDVLLQEGFLAVFPLLPAPVALEKAMEKEYTLKNISRTVLQLMRLIQYYKK